MRIWIAALLLVASTTVFATDEANPMSAGDVTCREYVALEASPRTAALEAWVTGRIAALVPATATFRPHPGDVTLSQLREKVTGLKATSHRDKIQVPVTLSQSDDWWGVQALAHGTASQPNESTLEIALDDVSLRAKPNGKDRAVAEIKVCLARPTQSAWKSITCSSEHRIGTLLKPGDSIIVHDLVFAIPIPEGSQIASYFLVLTIEAPGIRGHQPSWHAFSEDDPLQDLQNLISLRRP